MKPCDLKKLAQVFVKQYFPEYLNRIDRIWGMLDNVDLNTPQKQFQLGSSLGFAAEASQELREVVSGLVAIRVTYEQEKDNAFIPPPELQKLIIEACEKLKVSPDVKVKLEKVTVDFTDANSSNEIVNAIETASSELKGTIEREHKNTRKEFNTPIVDHNYLTNWRIRLVRKENKAFINTGKEDKIFSVSNLQMEILIVLTQHHLPENTRKNFITWKNIIKQVPKWQSRDNHKINDDDIRRHIMNIRKLLGNRFGKIIEVKQFKGYRISTNPANISVE